MPGPSTRGHTLSHRAQSLLYRAVQRAFVCDVTRLMVLDSFDVQSPSVGRQFEFCFLSSGDVEIHAADAVNGLSRSLADRLVAGQDLCYAATAGDKMACYAWLALGSIEATHNSGRTPSSGVAASFPPTAAFVYKAFTRPEFRGHRLYAAVLARVLAELSSRGITHLITTAEWNNLSALSAAQHLGFQDLGSITRIACGPFATTITPSAASEFGIRLGRKAQVVTRIVVPRPHLVGAVPTERTLSALATLEN